MREYNSQMGIIGSLIWQSEQNIAYTDSDDQTNVKYKIKIDKADNQSACSTVYTYKCIYTSLLRLLCVVTENDIQYVNTFNI